MTFATNQSEEKAVVRESLRDLVIYLQFKKRQKHSWRSIAFNKVAG